jgi:hypothetical protein
MPKNLDQEPHSGAVERSPLLTKADVAHRAKCGRRMINYWMQRGLPYVKLSPRMVRFVPGDVEAFLQSHRIGGAK